MFCCLFLFFVLNNQSKSSIRAFLNSSSCDTGVFSKVSNLSSTDIELLFTTVSEGSATSDADGCDGYFIKPHRKDEQIRDTGGGVDESVFDFEFDQFFSSGHLWRMKVESSRKSRLLESRVFCAKELILT